MHDLVALDLPAGPTFVDALRTAWDAGDAVLPIDPRLPPPATARLLDACRPARIISRDGAASLPSSRPVEPGDALVVATSGTSGEPKGVVHTRDSIHASALATSTALSVDPGRDHWVACLPLAHIGGLSVITRSICTDTRCTVLPGFDATEVERLSREGATLVSLVATALARTDVSRYRAVLLGGAAPPESVPEQVVTTYGMTETGSGCVYAGRPLPGVEILIGDGTLGGLGEILVRGPMLLRCYRDGSDPRLPGGWLPTGDGGHLGVDGNLVVHGRLADVIVTGGEKVWPAAVESVVSRHPSVAEVAVWKRPDPEWGERVVAWVVPRPGSDVPTTAELRDLIAGDLGAWHAPKEVVAMTALPRTAGGKVRRFDLT